MADASSKWVTSTQITHVGSGTSLAAAAVNPSSDVSTALTSTNLFNYPYMDVALMATFSASIALASNTIALFRRDNDIDSTNDEKAPDTSNLAHFLGNFVVPGSTTVSTTHYLNLENVPIPQGPFDLYMQNNTGVNLKVGWTLKVTPKTLAGATA